MHVHISFRLFEMLDGCCFRWIITIGRLQYQNSKMTLRFPSPNGHTQYNPLPLSVSGTCEDVEQHSLIRLRAG